MFISIPSTAAFQAGTAPIKYSLHGQRNQPLIVFCNGIGASTPAWSSLLSILSSEYCCLLWRYDGTEDLPTSDLSISSHATMLCSVLEHIEKTPFAIIGWSMGVQVALQTAHLLKVPPDGLILLNGAASNPTSDVLNQKWIWPLIFPLLKKLQHSGSWLKRLGYEAQASPLFLKAFTRFFISARCLSSELDQAAFLTLLQTWFAVDLRHIARQLLLLDESDNKHHASSFQGPTLVIAGDTDPLVALCRTEDLSNLLHNSELVILDRSSHFSLMEKTEDLNKIISAFLKKIELQEKV